MSRLRSRLFDGAAAIGAAALLACAIAHAIAPARLPVVHLRWREGVDPVHQRELHQRYALDRCQPVDVRTEACELLDTTRRNVAQIVSDPDIEDTHHIDRDRLALDEDVARGPVLTWIARVLAWFRQPRIFTGVLVSGVVLLLGGLLPRVWRLTAPVGRALAIRFVTWLSLFRMRATREFTSTLPRIWSWLLAWTTNPAALLWALAVALLIAQFSAIVVELGLYATDSGHIRAFDEDAALAIDVTQRTRWYNDNDFRFYGPFYYRAAHTLESLAPLADQAKNSHFHLLLTSLLSMYGVGLVLLLAIPMSWPMRLLSVGVVSAAFLRQDVWRELLFRARLDWLLSLCAAGFGVSLLLLRRQPRSNTYLLWSALALALGLLTKFIFVFFIPSALILFFSHPVLRTRWKAMTALSGGLYFLIGFPQSLRVKRDFEYVQSLSSGYSQSADIESTREWLSLFGTQLIWPLAALLIAWLLFATGRRGAVPDERGTVSRRLVELSAVMLPLALLLSQKIGSAHHYYTVPFVAFALAGVAVAAGAVRLPWALAPRFHAAAFVAMAAAVIATGWLVPRNLGSLLASEAECRPHADRVYRFLEERAKNGETVYMDPFVPRPTAPELARYWKGTYTNNWRTFIDASPRWVVMYSGHFGVYLGNRPDYVNLWTRDAAASETFYQSFPGHDRVSAPDGRTLTLQDSYPCGWQVWKVDQ